MRIALGTVLTALVLTGCGESQIGGSMFYLKPYNIENFTCAELKTRIDAQAYVIKQKADLREKAATDSVGSAIGASVYGPDQNAARWSQRQYEQEYERKNCTAPPPPPPPVPAGVPPAGAATPPPPKS